MIGWSSRFQKEHTDHVRMIYIIYIKLVKKKLKIQTCNALDSETLECWPMMPKISTDIHCNLVDATRKEHKIFMSLHFHKWWYKYISAQYARVELPINGWMSEWMNETWMCFRWIDGCILDRWMKHGCFLDIWMDGWMDEWMNECNMDVWKRAVRSVAWPL